MTIEIPIDQWLELVELLGLPAADANGDPPVTEVVTCVRVLVGRKRRHAMRGKRSFEENRALGMWAAVEHLRVALEALEHWKLPRPKGRRRS